MQYGSLEGGGATMTWGSSVITGVQELFGLCPTSKEWPSPTKCPDRGLEKGDTSKMVKPEKWTRGKGDDFAAISHDSNTCPGLPWVPHDLHPILIFNVKVHSLEQ